MDAAQRLQPTRGFQSSLEANGLSVIAEIKRRSPSKGDLSPDLDPTAVAAEYEAGGASAISVLTDHEHFGGSEGDLQAARLGTSLPVLRKDFTVDLRDVADARLMGADAVLLIAAVLDTEELGRFHDLATDLGLDALVEVHDEAELESALEVGATLIGVNQRDLVTFEVDTGRALRMAAGIPSGITAVAESGVRDSADAALLASAGYDAVLVGESTVTSLDRSSAVRSLSGHTVGPRHRGARA
jgi:indole-3-glycerol phosphate synthase